ncbi:endonuclease/exonuclease/phosphatase family protein [Kitasatospora sp. NPDC092286]|uniref:endonuclease/exonuclease/phosphatase family protein n=1 Tax=Kitasatospora sp. NPDC092286 TaxID=3364087 RepID=UPI0038210F77
MNTAPPAPDAQLARFAYWNVEHGRRLTDACAWLRTQTLDLLVWGELQPGDLSRVEDALDMVGYAAADTEVTDNTNAILLRPDGPFVFDREFKRQHRRAPWIPKANIQVGIRSDGSTGSGRLILVGEHSCYYGPTIRQIEAEWYSTVIKHGRRVLAMGDWNSYPVGEVPDLGAITDLAHLHDRTYLHPSVGRVPDTRPDEDLTTAGYIDLARHAAVRNSYHLALGPTAGYAPSAAGHGGEQRIDRAYADPSTASALVAFEPVRGLEEISDHRPLVGAFDLARLRAAVDGPHKNA